MAVIRFGKIYACSRCPGWQSEDANSAIGHVNNHNTADLAVGVCPVCVRPYDHKEQDGRNVRAVPCGHQLYQGHV